MKIMRFEGTTEPEAINKVKETLGENAVILNIKKIKPRGLFKFFKKTRVEVMAAYESTQPAKKNNTVSSKTQRNKKISKNKNIKSNKIENNKIENNKIENNIDSSNSNHDIMVKDFKIQEQQIKINNLESKLTSTEDLLNKVSSSISDSMNTKQMDTLNSNQVTKLSGMYSNNIVQLFFDTLTKGGVTKEIAERILDGLDNSNSNINMLVKIVYNRIIEILGNPIPIALQNINDVNNEHLAKVIICIGPTGVGKTTTIAKLCSYFILSKQLKVGLITADTYRIAAVDQLKTYADILGLNVSVVYSPDELSEAIATASNSNDIVFIDTAGRSHKNLETIKELELILLNVPNSERFLVLSATTKYEDMLNIIKVYSDLTDYKIIFTKIDETSSLGAILNICYLTKKPLSYITDGQDVPDDIKIAQPELIARTLLGSSDV